jgi:hypothetical protein
MGKFKHASPAAFLPVLLICILGFSKFSFAQSGDEPIRKFSLILNGGVTYASDGSGMLGPLIGHFDVASFRQPVYGGSIQIAVNPTWSFETAFNMGSFENQYPEDPEFTTDYMYATFRGITHLNGLLNLNWGGARFINPYAAIGLGMIRTELAADGLESEDLSLMLSGGLGTAFYIFRGADLFVQYDYNLAGSNLLDGFSGNGSSDKFAVVKAGLRINFGKKDAKLASWPPSVPRARRAATQPEPEPEPVSEEEPVAEPERPDLTWVADLGAFMESSIAKHPEFVERALERARRMREARLRAEARAEEMARLEAQRRAAAEVEIRRVSTPPDGAYIQIGSFPNNNLADEKWREVVANLEGVIMNPAERVLIQEYMQYRRVMIGPFGTVGQARIVLNAIRSDYGDAFLITFPRN